MSSHLGYARVSTSKQTLDQQLDALAAAGVTKTFQDVMSGTRDDRPGLRQLLDYAREGDVVTVVALDRLGRSLTHVLATIGELQDRGIVLRSLREGIDFSTPTGRFQAAVFSAMAELERELIRERAASAREAAAARGRHIGRPRALTDEQVSTARQMRAAGIDITAIASTLRCSRATVYRVTENVAEAS